MRSMRKILFAQSDTEDCSDLPLSMAPKVAWFYLAAPSSSLRSQVVLSMAEDMSMGFI